MKRSFNYTGRRLIAQRDVSVSLMESRVGGTSSLMLSADLMSYEFPSDSDARLVATTKSSVWVAYSGPTGQVDGRPVRIDDADQWVDGGEWDSVSFRFKVVDPRDLRLLGATGPPLKLSSVPMATVGLLNIYSRELGELPYRLDIEESGPQLLLSTKLWEHRHTLIGNPTFRGTALPDILRQVLIRAVLEQNLFDLEEGANTWFTDWIDWMQSEPNMSGFPENLDQIDDDDTVLRREWIEEVVAAFASLLQHRFVTSIQRQFAKSD